jgi:hypothetical protein
MRSGHRAGRFTSETPEEVKYFNRWDCTKKRRESLTRTYEEYEGAKALLAEWEAVPMTMEAVQQIKRLRKKIASLNSRLRYKGMI